jgi:hypothetical protein
VKTPSVSRAAEVAARNEILFREANERIAQRGEELGIEAERTPFLCECDDVGCNAVVLLSKDQYTYVRDGGARWFLVAHDHANEHTRTVADHGTFRVIEKTGEAGEAAERMTT